MTNEEVEKILNEIKSNLTGDNNKDHPYLVSQLEKYNEHELRTEILPEISKIVFEVMSSDE